MRRNPVYCYILEGWDDILTPHVLSEWMVEVCRFEVRGVRVGEWLFVI
jgi:hypothetical protein